MRTDKGTGSSNRQQTKRRVVNAYHRRLANPLMRRVSGRLAGQAILETIGRRSGAARRTPVGGRLVDGSFWLVSNHGQHSDYVKNILVNPRVRLLHRGHWYTGVAHVLDDDDAARRLKQLPRLPSFFVRLQGTTLTTIRIDLDEAPR
jgi:deazaflavin-dependent oxidoreductase (nitroreductase family)